MVVYVIKTPFDIALHKPFCSCQIFLHIRYGCVTASFGSETMWAVLECRFVNTFQNHPDYFLYQFVLKGRDSQRTHFPIRFRDIDSPCRWRLVRKIPELSNQRLYTLHAHSVNRLSVCAPCHVPWLCLNPAVGSKVELWVVEVAV